jgi:hypothetical protein
MLPIPEGSALWDAGYNTVSVVKPAKTLTRAGRLIQFVYRPVRKEQKVTAMIGGASYYLGKYKLVNQSKVNFEFFQSLSTRVTIPILSSLRLVHYLLSNMAGSGGYPATLRI